MADGVIYSTAMSRPDAAMALAAMYFLEHKGDAKVGAVCVSGAGLNTAIYCDIVNRFYNQGPLRNGNQSLMVGLALSNPMPADPPMIRPALEKKTEKGDVEYLRSVNKVSDTSMADAVLRNAIAFNATSAYILSSQATQLAKTLELPSTLGYYKARAKSLVIVDAGVPQKDVAALKRIVAEWPGPVFYMGREVGESLALSSDKLEKGYAAWAPAHPVADAIRAYKSGTYEIPTWDLAAVQFVAHPDANQFQASGAGTLQVADDGSMKFVPGSGNVKRLTVDPAKKTELLAEMLEAATAKPPAPAPRGRGGRGFGASGGRGASGGFGAFGFSGGRGGAPGASGR